MKKNLPTSPIDTVPLGLSPTMFGVLCCVISAVLYTAANTCMRQLSRVHCDGTWAVCNREAVSFVLVGGWLVYRSLKGKANWPPLKFLGILFAAGLGVQLLGNVGMQWAYGIAGMGFMVSSNIVFNLMSGAILGYLLLREALGGRQIAAMAILLLAVVALWLGATPVDAALPATDANTIEQSQSSGPMLIAVALATSLVAGVFFSLQNITIRYCMKQGVPMSVVVLFITGCGALTLGPWCMVQLASPVAATPLACYPWMYAAGICNFLAFIALIRGLKFTTVTHVTMVSTLQVALAALAGILFFGEPASVMLLAGVVLTMVGIAYFGKPAAAEEKASEAVVSEEARMPVAVMAEAG
jgi:drug/metabolite transporter (DMT)-like permease